MFKIFTKRNLLRVLAIGLPIFVIKTIDRPFEYLLRDTNPSMEYAMIIVISSTIFTITLSVIAVLICIKIWNKYSKPSINT